ncbi:class E sortase, partial [Streptomyces hydrogenans]
MPWQDTPHSTPHDAPHVPRYDSAHHSAYDVPHPTGGPCGAGGARTDSPPGPGRAERRRAAAKKGRRGRATPGRASPRRRRGAQAAVAARPLSRVEARRAAREAKGSLGAVVGELFITLGVVMLLFVAYQLWWTNVLAGQETNQAKEKIEDTWAKGESKP